MKVSPPNLFIVLERFPERKDGIKRLLGENNNFRSACEDYGDCIRVLRYWNQSDSEEAPARRVEYGELMRALEAEILEYLSKGEGKEGP